MPELVAPWTLGALLLAALGALLARAPFGLRAGRGVANALAVSIFVLSLGPLAEIGVSGSIDRADPWVPFLVVDALSAVLLPFAALLFGVITIVRPRMESSSAAIARAFGGELLVLALFVSRDPLSVAAIFCATIALLLWDLRAQVERRAFRVVSRYMIPSAALVVAGAALLRFTEGELAAAGAFLVLLGAMIRKGIFPFHSFLPELFEHGSWSSAIWFTAPQVAAYTVVRLVVPHAGASALEVVGVAALVTSVYGAGAALVQRDARRGFGYLFMSQSALVMAGLDCTSVVGLAGGLSTWISSGIALTGLGATMWLLESRSGRLALDRFRGGYENKPLLAVAFLLLGLASVGFPGTLGFVAEELLIDGAVAQYPHIGFAIVAATALNGISVLRMYFALFCGRVRARVPMHLLPRERLAVVALLALVIAMGIAPHPIVDLQTQTATRLLTP